MAALEDYISGTSSALFKFAARIMGQQSDEIDHLARHAGLAQGIVRVIEALPRDAARRQLFVPLQTLEQHGSGAEEVFAGKQTPKLRAALDQLIGEARVAFENGVCLASERASRSAAGISAAGAGSPRSPAHVARRRGSVRAPRKIAAPHIMDAVAGIARQRVLIRMMALGDPPISKLNRSRKFLRDSRIPRRNARSLSPVIIGSIRSSWFVATSCNISMRTLPALSRGSACTT